MYTPCPSCNSGRVVTKNIGKQTGGLIGAAGGAASGAAGALSGAEAGAVLGVVGGHSYRQHRRGDFGWSVRWGRGWHCRGHAGRADR